MDLDRMAKIRILIEGEDDGSYVLVRPRSFADELAKMLDGQEVHRDDVHLLIEQDGVTTEIPLGMFACVAKTRKEKGGWHVLVNDELQEIAMEHCGTHEVMVMPVDMFDRYLSEALGVGPFGQSAKAAGRPH